MEYFYFSSDFYFNSYDELANLLAGVAILLIGMTNLGIGFKAFSGGLLEKILAKLTDIKIKSILFGTLSTLIMQSSTLVSIYYDFFFECRAYFFGCGHKGLFLEQI